MNAPPIMVIAAGGTGGHMFPAQSIAESLGAQGARLVLITDPRGARHATGFAEDVEQFVIGVDNPSSGSLISRLGTIFQIARASAQIWRGFRNMRPDAVIGFGGYPSLPALLMARLMNIPYFIHEQNAILGKVNSRFHRQAKRIACGQWPVEGAGENAHWLGTPVRAHLAAMENAPCPKIDESGPIHITIFAGSQGAKSFSTLIPEAICAQTDLASRLHITQQVRDEDKESVAEHYERAGITAELAPFFSDLPERIKGSHLVIARAGASTLAELQFIGRPSILVPLPRAANDHQRANARIMQQAGAAKIFDEEFDEPQKLGELIEALLSQPDLLAQMGGAAYGLAKPDAARAFADIITSQL